MGVLRSIGRKSLLIEATRTSSAMISNPTANRSLVSNKSRSIPSSNRHEEDEQNGSDENCD